MDALEAFSQIVGFWPNSFKPREMWRDVALEELKSWTPDDRAGVVKSLQVLMGKSKTVDIETLRAARTKSPARRSSLGNNTEEAFLARLGLTEDYKRQHICDRVMISRLIRCVMRNPGWEGVLEEQAGDARHFKSWERIENLLNAAEKATTQTKDGRVRKCCYPSDKDGWEAPTEPMIVHLPRPRKRHDIDADRAGMETIFKIANMYGGLKLGNHGAIYRSPEYQQYLRDYTERTGLEPA